METVLIVDDHAGFRAWVREMLESEGFRVVGEASDASSAITAAEQLQADIVLLDVHLPDGSGDAIINAVARDRPGVRFQIGRAHV